MAPLIDKLGEGCNKTVTKMDIANDGRDIDGNWATCTYFGNYDFAICGRGGEVVKAYTDITNEWLKSFGNVSKCDKC